MIFSAYYYPQDSLKGPYIRSEQFFPGKHFESFPVWYQYVRRLYPHEDIILLDDGASKVPLTKALAFITEPYEWIRAYKLNPAIKFHIKGITPERSDGVNPIRYALFEAVTCAYLNKSDLLWIDTDCFVNTDVRKLLGTGEVFTVKPLHDEGMMETFFFYVSAKRLRAFDELFFLPRYLANVLAIKSEYPRMRFSQEWGFYQLFYYGDVVHSTNLNITHLSCLDSMIRFLEKHPLITPEYTTFLQQCYDYRLGAMTWPRNVCVTFADVYHEQQD
jgi:hypothetical protein